MPAEYRDTDGTRLVRDRTGDLVPVLEPVPAEHVCDGGWLADDALGRRRPCPVCKPHLKHYRDHGWRRTRRRSA